MDLLPAPTCCRLVVYVGNLLRGNWCNVFWPLLCLQYDFNVRSKTNERANAIKGFHHKCRNVTKIEKKVCKRRLKSYNCSQYGSVHSVILPFTKTDEQKYLFGQWAAATCAAPPSVIAGQYATSHCKPLLAIVRVDPVV